MYEHDNLQMFFSKVQIEDHVIFESEKAKRMYLHTSSRTYNQTTLHENM